MTKEEYTQQLIEMNKKSYDQGFKDACRCVVEALEVGVAWHQNQMFPVSSLKLMIETLESEYKDKGLN